jgi:hypothetical protein
MYKDYTPKWTRHLKSEDLRLTILQTKRRTRTPLAGHGGLDLVFKRLIQERNHSHCSYP